jgi:ferrous iron transport protein A
MENTLLDIKSGNYCRVKYIKPNNFRPRLLEIGIVNDTIIQVIKPSPFKDPIEYKIGDFFVGLRRSEASLIVVDPIK